MKPAICENCLFFSWGTYGAPICRRYPPQMVGRNGGISITERFPSTDKLWWCGEYKLAKAEAAQSTMEESK